jgi:hypothetical protein
VSLNHRLRALEGLVTSLSPFPGELTHEQREAGIARLFEAAEGPDADLVEPGQTMTIRARAARVQELLDEARRRMEQAECS